MTSPQQHDDPFGEARGQVLQALAVLATVGESAARFAVAGAQNRAAKAERRARGEQVAAAGREYAEQAQALARKEQDRIAQRLFDRALAPQWRDQADLAQTAQVWRTAAMYASVGDSRARQTLRVAEDRLRQLNPILMDAYGRHWAAGMNLAEAMRAAAHDVSQHEARANATPRARPHGNNGEPSAALRVGIRAIGRTPDPHAERMVDEMEAAVRAEVARLAEGVDPELLDRLQRQWRSAGHAPAADAAALLAQAARQLHADAQLAGPTTGSATIRRGVNDTQDQPGPVTYDTVDAPIRTASAGYELAAQGIDRAAELARSAQAADRHLSAQAHQQQRAASIDQGQIDVPATAADEHRDGLAAGQLRRGNAQHDQTGADQQRRLGQAFPPLRNLRPTFAAPTSATNAAAPAPRKGKSR